MLFQLHYIPCSNSASCTSLWTLLLLLILTIAAPSLFANPSVRDDLWVTNGVVYSSVNYGDNAGYSAGAAVALNTVSGLLDTGFPKVTGTVNVIVANGTDNWYIGGNFSSVGGIARNNIARINADKTVDLGWDPDADGAVNAMILVGTTLVVGGDFTHIGGVARNRMAAMVTTQNSDFITPWNPDVDAPVLAMALYDTTLYFGGEFTQAGGQARSYVAAVDANIDDQNNTIITPWNPGADGFVRSLQVSADGRSIYVGGDFTTIGGSSRNRIAGLDAGTDINNATVWNPDANGSVDVLFISGNTIYVGGDFTSIGGKSRNRIAALNTLLDINNATNWDPDSDARVRTIILDGNLLYAGGDFTVIGGKNRSHIAVLQTSVNTNNATSWNPGLDGPVYGMARASSTLYAGGAFNSVIDNSRLYIGGDFTYVGPNNGAGVGIDIITAQASNVFPVVNGPVYVAVSDGANGWYIGGAFSDVGGTTRNNIAHIQQSGTAYIVEPTWDPNANGPVYALALAGGTIYVGGAFTTIGGASRNNIASVATADGSIDGAWDVDPDGTVRALVLSGGVLYLGGDFINVNVNAGAQTRHYIAAVDTADAGNEDVATAWNPDADGIVRSMLVSAGTIYVGGDFTSFNGGADTRQHLASLDAATGLVSSWTPDANATVRALALSGTTLYIGGDFTTVDGDIRNRIAALDTLATSPNIATTWNPNLNNNVRALLYTGAALYVGGDFTAVGGVVRKHIAELDTATGLATSWLINAGNSVFTLSLSDDSASIYAGGNFLSIGGVIRDHLAALDLISGTATSWDPGADDVVRSIIMSEDVSTLYVGGDFTSIGGKARNRIAAIDRISALATPWDPDANDAVYTLLLDSDDGVTLYVGGEFTAFNGNAILRNHIASLATDATNNTAIINSWDPNASDGAVRTMAQFGTTLYVGGDFTSAGTIGGQNRNHIAALRTTSSSASAWDPDADGNILAMSLSADGRLLYVGGNFLTFDSGNIARNHIAVLDTTSVVAAEMLTSWNPDANDVVRAMSLSSDESILYIGGDFTTLGGGTPLTRNRMAAVATSDGAPISWWDTDTDAPVFSMRISDDGGLLYNGGDYKLINDSARSHFAAIEISPPVTHSFPLAGAYSIPQDITLICDDNFGTDCASTYYTIDGSPPTVSSILYSVPFTISTDTTVKFFSIDSAGNEEAVQTAVYLIESGPPVTTASPAGGILAAGNNTVTLICTDAEGGCAKTYYTQDGTTPTTSSTVYTVPILLEDDTTLKFFSVDNAGNVETPVNTENYIVDLSTPRTSASPPTRVFDAGKLTISFTCDDTPLPPVEPGVGDIPQGAVDPNTGSFPSPTDFNNPVSSSVTTTTVPDVVLIAAITNTGTGCAATYYTTDDSTPTTASTRYTGPFVINDSTIVKFFSVDNAGNVEGIELASYVNRRSSVGSFGPFTLILLFISIGMRFYLGDYRPRSNL
jgi:Chitobiase/beta-hexosaminidase C-terminal domain/Fn3 associated/Domain of unknown function (DUF5122) beta-propeller